MGNDSLLVGLIIADRSMHPPTVIGMIHRAWVSFGTFAIEPLADRRTYAIMAPSAAAADGVLSSGPWCINGAVLSLHDWPTARRIDQILLYLVTFWIQIHGLSPDEMTVNNGHFIASQAGRIVDMS